jgi:hypothetical protein
MLRCRAIKSLSSSIAASRDARDCFQRRSVSHHSHSGSPTLQPPTPQEIVRGFLVLEMCRTTTTSFAEVRKRYYELAKLHHPDAVCPVAAEAPSFPSAQQGPQAAMRPHEQHLQPRMDPIAGGTIPPPPSQPPATRSAADIATERMIQINEAFETLRRAHSAGLLSPTTNGTAAANKNINVPPGGGGAVRSSSTKTTSAPSSASERRRGDHGGWAWPFGNRSAAADSTSERTAASSAQSAQSAFARMVRSDASRRSLRFLYNEATPALRNPFIETKEEEAPNFDGFYFERSYAKIVSGRTVTTRFDIATGYFMLTFQGEPFCESNITRIVIHEELHYPFGFEVSLTIAPPAPQGMKTGENGDDIFHNVEGNRPKCPKKHFSDCNTRRDQKHSAGGAPSAFADDGTTRDPLSRRSTVSETHPTTVASVVQWTHPRRNLVEVHHDRRVVGHGRLLVTVAIRPKMATL